MNGTPQFQRNLTAQSCELGLEAEVGVPRVIEWDVELGDEMNSPLAISSLLKALN